MEQNKKEKVFAEPAVAYYLQKHKKRNGQLCSESEWVEFTLVLVGGGREIM